MSNGYVVRHVEKPIESAPVHVITGLVKDGNRNTPELIPQPPASFPSPKPLPSRLPAPTIAPPTKRAPPGFFERFFCYPV